MSNPDTREYGYFLVGAHAFTFGDQQRQGDRELPGGLAVYSMYSAQYNLKKLHVGAGFIYLHEFPSATQTNIGFAYKLEYNLGSYFWEYANGRIYQSFRDRAIARRDGIMHLATFGVRVYIEDPLDFFIKNPSKFYFEGTMRGRWNIFESEDGTPLQDKIIQFQVYPFLGVGYQY